MNASSAADLVAAFRRDRPLSHDLAAAIHPERWQALGIGPEAAGRLGKCRRSCQLLSSRLDWLCPGGLPEWDGSVAPPREADLARWSGEALWRGARFFGTAKNREAVAKLVWRDDVANLKQQVGGDAYFFALRRASLVWRDVALEGSSAEEMPLTERIIADAGLGLGCWLADLPKQWSERLRLKLPPCCDGPLDLAAAWKPERRDGWRDVFLRVFRESGT